MSIVIIIIINNENDDDDGKRQTTKLLKGEKGKVIKIYKKKKCSCACVRLYDARGCNLLFYYKIVKKMLNKLNFTR